MLRFFLAAIAMGIIWFISDSLLHVSRDWLFLIGFFIGAVTEKFIINPMVLKNAHRK